MDRGVGKFRAAHSGGRVGAERARDTRTSAQGNDAGDADQTGAIVGRLKRKTRVHSALTLADLISGVHFARSPTRKAEKSLGDPMRSSTLSFVSVACTSGVLSVSLIAAL